MSVGAAIFPHDGDTYESLLATADGRMYRDKTRRKRAPVAVAATGTDGAGVGRVVPAMLEPGDVDIERAGMGVL
jgi:predicted signal transduction protein with EAL and GGDEF domain